MKKIPPSPLLGEANPNFYIALDGNGLPVDINEVVFPIVRQSPEGLFELIGTGFFITTNGIFASAKHVLLDVIGKKCKQIYPIGLVQFLSNNQYILRPISRCATNNIANVGIGVASKVTHKVTGEPLLNKILTLTTLTPTIGSIITTYAYPKTVIYGIPTQELHFYPTYYEGELKEYFPNGRDKALLPAPCYMTSIHIHGGASGGPVFGPNGRVFGINSTGIDSTDISFISRINGILPLIVEGTVLPGNNEPRPVSILELEEKGFVVFKPPLANNE